MRVDVCHEFGGTRNCIMQIYDGWYLDAYGYDVSVVMCTHTIAVLQSEACAHASIHPTTQTFFCPHSPCAPPPAATKPPGIHPESGYPPGVVNIIGP